jgi:hypothetical protein
MFVIRLRMMIDFAELVDEIPQFLDVERIIEVARSIK